MESNIKIGDNVVFIVRDENFEAVKRGKVVGLYQFTRGHEYYSHEALIKSECGDYLERRIDTRQVAKSMEELGEMHRIPKSLLTKKSNE